MALPLMVPSISERPRPRNDPVSLPPFTFRARTCCNGVPNRSNVTSHSPDGEGAVCAILNCGASNTNMAQIERTKETGDFDMREIVQKLLRRCRRLCGCGAVRQVLCERASAGFRRARR